MTKRQINNAVLGFCLLASTAACSKKVASAPPPPAPTPAAAPATAKAPVETAARTVPVSAPSPVAETTAPKQSLSDLLRTINDAFFDYDKATLRADAVRNLNQNAGTLKNVFHDFPTVKLQIEGYCDERGSEEYNLALGDRRAIEAKEYMVQLGVPGSQLSTISYGKERPQCAEHDEACWQKNRRAHVMVSN